MPSAPDRRWGGVIIAAFVLLLALTAWLHVWPIYAQANEIRARTVDLQRRMDDLHGQASAVASLQEQLAQAQKRIDTELKEIPESPDLAELIRKLSLPVDKVRVQDQTFTAGSPSEAAPGAKLSLQAMPLTVEMEATFDSVFALLRNAESVHRLLRIASVSLLCKRDDKQPDVPLVSATVSLEAIFEPPAAPEAAHVSQGSRSSNFGEDR